MSGITSPCTYTRSSWLSGIWGTLNTAQTVVIDGYELMKLPPGWQLPSEIKNRFGQKSSGKQRAMIAQDHLLLVLHKVPQPGDHQRTGTFFWRKPDGRWEHSGGGVGMQTLVKHLREYEQVEGQLSRLYEEADSADDYFELLEAMSPVRRSARNLYSTLQAARKGIPHDRDIIDMRDWAYELERTLDLLYENTKNAMDFRMAQRAEEQARLTLQSVDASHRLNVLAAIFFPLTAVSCVFGMNLASGLESDSILAFWTTSALAVTLGLWVRRWVTTGKWL